MRALIIAVLSGSSHDGKRIIHGFIAVSLLASSSRLEFPMERRAKNVLGVTYLVMKRFENSTRLIISILGLLSKSGKGFRPPLLSEELGCSPTLSLLLGRPDGFFFDPFGLATDANFARLRECELKHGRISMLAILGVTLPPLLQLFGKELLDISARDLPSASIVENLSAMAPIDYINIIVTCGFLESFVFIQRDPKDMPGDVSCC